MIVLSSFCRYYLKDQWKQQTISQAYQVLGSTTHLIVLKINTHALGLNFHVESVLRTTLYTLHIIFLSEKLKNTQKGC
jgi:hypothetical protein